MSERELPELPPDVVTLLDAARRPPAPSGEAMARVRARLDETLGGPPGDGGPGGGGGGSPAGGGWFVKLGAAGAVLSLGVAGFVAVDDTSSSTRETAPKPNVALAPTPTAAPLAAAPVPVDEGPTIESTVEETAAPARRRHRVDPAPARAKRQPRRRPPATLTTTGSSSLADEQAPLDEARAALAKRDGVRALAALAHHRDRFPNGALSEERDALEVLALAVSGRHDEARAAASAFRARFPNSLHTPAVDAAVR